MEFKVAISVFSGVLFVIGFIPYIKAILRGETKPAKASWIIWASLDYIVLAGMIKADTVNGQIIGAVVGATIVISLAMRYGVPGWTKIDMFCLAGAILGIIFLLVYRDNPAVGIVTVCIVAAVGSFPTFINACENPGGEDKLAWTIFWSSCVCAMIAIPHLTFEDAAQPTTFFLIESVMMYILYVKKPTV